MTTTTRPTTLEAAQRDLAPLQEEVQRRHVDFLDARASVRATRAALAEAEQRAEAARSRVATLRADADLRVAVGDQLPDAIAAAELQVEIAENAYRDASQERARLQVESSTGYALSGDFDYASGSHASPDRAERARDLLPAAATHEGEAQRQLDHVRGLLLSLTSQVELILRQQRAQASQRAFQEAQGIRRGSERSALRRFFEKKVAA